MVKIMTRISDATIRKLELIFHNNFPNTAKAFIVKIMIEATAVSLLNPFFLKDSLAHFHHPWIVYQATYNVHFSLTFWPTVRKSDFLSFVLYRDLSITDTFSRFIPIGNGQYESNQQCVLIVFFLFHQEFVVVRLPDRCQIPQESSHTFLRYSPTTKVVSFSNGTNVNNFFLSFL